MLAGDHGIGPAPETGTRCHYCGERFTSYRNASRERSNRKRHEFRCRVRTATAVCRSPERISWADLLALYPEARKRMRAALYGPRPLSDTYMA